MTERDAEIILRPLLTELFESGLDDAKWQQLRRVLANDPAARAEYVKFVSLHAQLTGELEWQAGEDPIAQIRSGPFKLARPALAIAAALLLTAAAVAIYLFAVSSEGGETEKPNGPDVAVVVEVDRGIFGSRRIASGDSVSTEAIELESGSITLDFISGGSVTLQGPARFIPSGERGGTLESGRLFARAPGDGSELKVFGPDFAVTDLGTAFAVHVNGPGDSDVFVTEGVVELTTDNGYTRKIRAGDGYHIGIDPTLSDLTDAQIIDAFGPAVLAQSDEERALLEAEPLAYFPLMRKNDGGWRDMIANTPLKAGGVVFDADSGAAVFDGKSAIELGEREDLMVDAPMTFAAEVWIDPGGETIQRIFSVDDGRASERIGWGVAIKRSRDGIHPRFTHYRVMDYDFTDVSLEPGRWLHLVFVVDTDVKLYVDGVERGTAASWGPMNRGAGHARVGRIGDNTELFHGRIRSIAVHDRALKTSEIPKNTSLGERP